VKLTDEESWEIRAATRPTDITWPNLCSVKMKAVEDTAVMTSNAAKWGLIVFWAIPIAAGGALSNLEQLGCAVRCASLRYEKTIERRMKIIVMIVVIVS